MNCNAIQPLHGVFERDRGRRVQIPDVGLGELLMPSASGAPHDCCYWSAWRRGCKTRERDCPCSDPFVTNDAPTCHRSSGHASEGINASSVLDNGNEALDTLCGILDPLGYKLDDIPGHAATSALISFSTAQSWMTSAAARMVRSLML